jgi:hypothetical protein
MGAFRQSGEIAWSPDGKRLAFSSPRGEDRWWTIWETTADCSKVRDLLPPGAPFASPGVRAIGISVWLNTEELAFVQQLRRRVRSSQ